MKRRIAAPEERCTAPVSRYARWKARRQGRTPEPTCSFKRAAGSSVCAMHQPEALLCRDRLRKLTDPEVAAIRAAYWEPRQRAGLLPSERPARDEPGGPFPTIAGLAAQYGVTDRLIHGVIHELTYREPTSVIQQRRATALTTYLATGSQTAAAEASGMQPGGVKKLLVRLGVWAHKRRAKQMRQMAARTWLAAGRRVVEVERLTGISRSTVSELRLRSAPWIQQASSRSSSSRIRSQPEDIEAWLERRRGGLLLAGGSE